METTHPFTYITDKKGRKTAVILSIEEYQDLLEDLEDLKVIAERREETSIPFDKVVQDLKKNGLL